MKELLYKHDLQKEILDRMIESELFDEMMIDLQIEYLYILKDKIVEEVREKSYKKATKGTF